jgi:hypothetical protein
MTATMKTTTSKWTGGSDGSRIEYIVIEENLYHFTKEKRNVSTRIEELSNPATKSTISRLVEKNVFLKACIFIVAIIEMC